MDGEKKRRIAYEVMILLGVLALLTFITRLWPILLLVMLGIIICALRLLFVRVKTAEAIVPATVTPAPADTEISIIQRAFGLLQCRVTESIRMQYPGARWIWGVTNPVERFKNSEPLVILLNSAGGYRKARVAVHNLMLVGISYMTLESENDTHTVPPESHEEPVEDDDCEQMPDDELSDDVPVNYERLAFEWVDAHMSEINARYNEFIAQDQSEMLIPSDDLPHPDSWPDVCKELKRNGFTIADFCEDGVTVSTVQ